MTDVPMDGILGSSPFGWQIEFFENHIINVRILLQPFTGSHLIGIVINMIKDSSARLLLIRTYK